jgi:hypothetical protein
LGRGGTNNRHPGNEQLRTFCHNAAIEYSRSGKNEKSQLSRDLVILVRQLNPPGRFLKKDQFAKAWMDVGDITAREKTSQVLRDAVNSLQCVSQRPIPPEVNSSMSQRSKVRPSPIRRSDNKVLLSKPYALQNLLVGLEGQNKKTEVMQRRGNVIVNAITPSNATAQEPLLPNIPFTDRKRMVADGDHVFQRAYPWVCDNVPLSSVGVNPSTRDSRHFLSSSRTNDSPCEQKSSTTYSRESIDELHLDWSDWLTCVDSFDDISKWDSEVHTNKKNTINYW